MSKRKKRTYVLIHGAWHGAWVWGANEFTSTTGNVASLLKKAGHTVITPDLSGLTSPPADHGVVNLSTHIDDVVRMLPVGVNNITLVGWSYGGIVADGVLYKDRNNKRIKSIIYLDAWMMDIRKRSLFEWIDWKYGVIERKKYNSAKNKKIGLAMSTSAFRFLGLKNQAMIKKLKPKLRLQPWNTFFSPVTMIWPRPTAEVKHTYIRCADNKYTPLKVAFVRAKKDQGIETDIIKTNHFAMLTAAEDTAKALLRAS